MLSEFEPGLESCAATFSCGHMLFISGKDLQQHYDEPCASCKNPINPEWQLIGAKLRSIRQYHCRTEGLMLSMIEKMSGIKKADIMRMESGKIDPAQLEQYWNEKAVSNDKA